MDCPIKKVAVVERWLLWRGGRCGGSTVSNSQVSVGYKAITFLQPVHNISWPSFNTSSNKLFSKACIADANKGRREGWGEAQREKGERAIAYMPGTKEKERRGKEKHKTRRVWRISCLLNPLSTFLLFPLPNSMPVTGKESACYKSLSFCIPPTNFPTLNLIMSTLNTWLLKSREHFSAWAKLQMCYFNYSKLSCLDASFQIKS